MTDQILSGVRIIDFSQGIAGPVATMLLAEAGADVIKVELPDGDAERDKAGFAVWNRSKRSVVLDLPAELKKFDSLLSSADVLVHDLAPTEAIKLRLDDTALRERHPDLIVSAITGYPQGHRLQNLPPKDAAVLAEAGIMDEQKGVARDGPIFIRFPLGSWGAAYLAANGIVARLIQRDRSGPIGPAHTSLLQGALIPLTMHWYRAEQPSENLRVGMPKDAKASIFECADGVWLHLMKAPDDAPLMKNALEKMGPEAVQHANAAAGTGHRMFPNWGANKVIFKTRPHHEWLDDLWASDVPVQPALPMGEIYFDEQAQANDYVVNVQDPKWGNTRQPGHPFTTVPPSRLKGAAPTLGENTEEIFNQLTKKKLRQDRSGANAAPLAGVKVLDFGNFLAGPLAAMLLSDLGADVIKVESTSGDQMRWVESAFTGCQRGKRSLALQLKNPAAKIVLQKLVQWADVVHHNLRMPAALKLGLDYEGLKAFNPKIVYCHVSSYGPKGPRKDWPGFDQLFQASCGWEYEGAGEGNPPMWHRFGMMDHQCALASLLATQLGLYHRDRTGEGQFVASSLLGASLLTVSETIVGPDNKLTPFERLDHMQLGVSPSHRLYQCRDGWVAVVHPSDNDGYAVQRAMGVQSAGDLESAFKKRTAETAINLLTEAGILATSVRLDQKENFFDAQDNNACGLVARYPHVEYGRFEQIGRLWNFGNVDIILNRAPPGLGQHSREVLAELGWDDNEVDLLIEQGVISAA